MVTAVSAELRTRSTRIRSRRATTVHSSALQRRARQIAACETGFISNASFSFSERDDAEWQTDLFRRIEQGERIAVSNEYTKSLPSYLARLCETPLLSREEEQSLFRRMNLLKFRANALRSGIRVDDPDAATLDQIDDLLARAGHIRNHIVRANMRLVISIVKGFANQNFSFDDLLSDGTACMMKAVDKFDYDRGFRFSTYATRAVRRELYRTMEKLRQQRVRFATNSDESLDNSGRGSTEEQLPRPTAQQLYRSLCDMIGKLDERERLVVKLRFGIEDGGTKTTFVEVGKTLGVSKERARQIGERAMNKLRAMAPEFGLDSFLTEG